MQDYKSLHVVVMMCATLVNTQTHRHKYRELLTDYTISSASLVHVYMTSVLMTVHNCSTIQHRKQCTVTHH